MPLQKSFNFWAIIYSSFSIKIRRKKEDTIEVSITQNDKIFSQVYLYICYSFNILRMTSVKSEIQNVCEISVKQFAHFMQTEL